MRSICSRKTTAPKVMRTRRQTNNAAWAQYRAIGAELQQKQSLLPLTGSDLTRLFDAAPRDGDESMWRRQFRTVREISPGRQFARLQEVSICELEVLLLPSNSKTITALPSEQQQQQVEAAEQQDKGEKGGDEDDEKPGEVVAAQPAALVVEEEKQDPKLVIGGNVRVVVKRGKRDWLDRARREAAVHRYLTDMQANSDDMPYLAPLLVHYDTATSSSSSPANNSNQVASSYIVTQFITLGPLADAIQSRRVHVNSHRLLHWINKADEVLRWMHGTARVVHTDAKSDNWLLKTKDDVILFDFDECWREEDFYDPQFFAILKRMDYAKFLFTLDDDLEVSGCNHLRRAVRDKSRALFGDTNPNRAFTTLFEQLGEAVDAWKRRVRQQQRQRQQSRIVLGKKKGGVGGAAADDMQTDEEEEELFLIEDDDDDEDASSRQVIRLPMRGGRIALI